MENIEILGGILNLLYKGKTFDLSNFDDRLIFQKTIYLLQSFGINLGYPFSWYLRGPYSPPLTIDGFELFNIFNNPEKMSTYNIKLEGPISDRFEDFKTFLHATGCDPYFLEILASIVFISKEYGYVHVNQILYTLKKSKFVDMDMFNRAIKLLNEKGLIKTVGQAAT